MKNWKTRLFIFAFIGFASIFSYSYLDTATPTNGMEKNTLYSIEKEGGDDKDVYLPDVEMVNKLIDASKKLKAFGL